MKAKWLAALTLLSAASLASAQTSYPMITHTTPVAVQRGQATEIEVAGRMNFAGVYKAFFEGKGITAEVVPVKGKAAAATTSVKLKVTVAANAPLGVREFRVVSNIGVSSIGQLVVVAEPVVAEITSNDTVTQAQGITLPSVLAGRLEKKEDVDYYKFEAKEGEQLALEVFCSRLQDKIHDLQNHAKPMVVLYDAEGRELAANDHFYFADPLLTYKIPKTGTYYLQIRESTYDGDPRWVYAVLATNKPYVSHVYPMAGNPGQPLEAEPVGTARGVPPKVSFTVPAELDVQQVQPLRNGQPINPVTFIVSPLSQVLEQEDNDTPEKATKVTVPCGINGRIGENRDLDHFAFEAKKGKVIEFEVKARRFGTLLNSSVHAVLDVMNSQGKIVASAIDTHGKEPLLTFTPPADGSYVLRVRDLNSKGGPSAIYFVSADWARQDFSLRCDGDKVMVGPGSGTAWFVKVERRNGFAGPVKVAVKNLPEGLSASPLTIPATMTEGVLVLSASAEAVPAAACVEVVGTATLKDIDGKEQEVQRQAQIIQEIYSPGGGRAVFPVNLATAAVTAPSDILKVKLSQEKVVLKPGQEVKIAVTLERKAGFDNSVSLDVILRHLSSVYGNPLPPGVTFETGKSKTLLGKSSQGHIVLKAAANAAPIEDVPVSVMAHVSVNFVVKMSYASPPLLISVRKE